MAPNLWRRTDLPNPHGNSRITAPDPGAPVFQPGAAFRCFMYTSRRFFQLVVLPRLLNQRAWIISSALVVAGYAAWVLLFVWHHPEIGLSCTAKAAVSSFDRDYVGGPNGKEAPDLLGWTVVEVGS